MPRGAMPVPRSELAAAEPYRPDGEPEPFVPSGDFPSPNQELATAKPFKPSRAAPESFLIWPKGIQPWGEDAIWAEEAFAKACAEPQILIPPDAVLSNKRECGSSNFAEFMQTRGFTMDGKTYRDGPFHSVDWTNEAGLNSAIAEAGPVKVGVAPQGISGKVIHGLQVAQPGSYCASLCGYGSLTALVALFERHGVHVDPPSGMPSGLWYAMFARGAIGVIDRQSLVNITGEVWVRVPTTVLKS